MHRELKHVEITETKGIFFEMNMHLADTVFNFEYQRLLPSSCLFLSVWIRAAPTGRISLKFYIGYFYENLSRKSRFIKVGQKMGHFTRRPKCVLSFSAVLCRHKSALFQWDSIRLLEHPTRYKYYANVQECHVIRTLSILLLKHCSQATQSPSSSSWKTTFLRLQYM